MYKVMAPVRDLGYLDGILEAGADGVYTGLQGSSRGRVCEGLQEKEIEELLIRCHKKGKLVHIALNAIPDSRLTDKLIEKISYLVGMGVDAIILNEVGIVSLAVKRVPYSSIFASVGCGILNIDDALFFEDLGVRGITLSWMVDPEEIYEIKRRTSLKVEVFFYALREFIQRGKCILGPYLMRGTTDLRRGGNCINICSARYEINSNGNSGVCLLPLEEYMVTDAFKSYIEAGVDLFKIQGREFNIEKIRKIVSIFRHISEGRGN